MKRSGTILLGLMLVFLAYNAAQADMTFTFTSPQDDGNGNIPGAAPFELNVHLNYTEGETSFLLGGTFGFYIYSDDGTIATMTLRPVTGGHSIFPCVTFSTAWTSAFSALNQVNFDGSVGDAGFNGALPDTVFFNAISFVGFMPSESDPITLHLQVDNAIGGTSGILCIDSSGQYINSDWDWLFDATQSGVVTVENKCWTITGLTPTDVHAISDSDDLLPSEFGLGQNYPNPFNPSTTFEFALPQRSQVMIEVFNVLGQKVVTLAEGDYAAGRYQVTWDGTDNSGGPVASGIYFYKMLANNYSATKKLLLLK